MKKKEIKMFNCMLNQMDDRVLDGVAFEYLQKIKEFLDLSIMITVINQEGKFIYANEYFCKVSQYSHDELLLQNYWMLNSGFHSDNYLREICEQISRGERWKGELCNKTKSGELFWGEANIIPLLDEMNNAYQYLIIQIDITEQKNLEKWKYMAFHDDLTSLPNRRMFNLCFDSCIQKADEKQTKLAILFMDIDQFKYINDHYGHLIGDEFLKEVGVRLSSLFSGKNRIFRQSGDEFIILLDDVEKLEEKVHSIISLFNHPFDIKSHTFNASISIGISLYPDHSSDQSILLRYADRAMFVSKQYEGSNYRIFQTSMVSSDKME